MIVVAIIGILAAIAIPAYQNYTAKSQTAAGLAEISPAKTNAEAKLAEGISNTIASSTELGVQGSTSRCAMKVSIAKDGASKIECKLKGTSSVDGKVVQWVRTADTASSIGEWKCVTNVNIEFAPKTCDTTGTVTPL